MTRRSRRVIPASLLALAILAVCVVAIISVSQELAGQAPLVPLAALGRHVRALRLDGAVMVTAGAVAAGVGLILLGCALIPGRSETLPLSAPGQEAGQGAAPVSGVSRTGLRRALAATVADVDGVTAARVRVRVRRVTARVRTELDSPQALRAAVSHAVDQRLSQAGLARAPDVRVSVRRVYRRAAA
jgi:hypothetical protein